LSPDGIHRGLLSYTAGFSGQFETRISGAKDPDDPSIYQVQLERYWGELRQSLPCILIIDIGFDYENPGLGGLTDSFQVNNKTSAVQMSMLANISFELRIAAMDETTCGDLRDIVTYILGPLTHINKGHVIRSFRPEDKWEVRLPLSFEPSGLENQPVFDDPKDILWTTSITMDVVFEGLINVGFDNQTNPEIHVVQTQFDGLNPIGFRLDTGQAIATTSGPSIDSISVPSEVRLNQHALISAEFIPANAHFVSDDPRVALIDMRTCAIVPKRLGTFNLSLVNYPKGETGPEIVRTWEVKVVPS
jgi:hypothetical protein